MHCAHEISNHGYLATDTNHTHDIIMLRKKGKVQCGVRLLDTQLCRSGCSLSSGCMAASEKSEGELSSSDCGEEEEEKPPSPKRGKVIADTQEPPADKRGSCVYALSKRQEKKRNKKKRKHARQQRKKNQRMQKCKDSSWNTSIPVSVENSSLANQCINSDQAMILTQLAALLHPSSTPGVTSDTPSMPPESTSVVPSPTSEAMSSPFQELSELKTIKTVKLQGIILHLLLGVPWLENPIEGLEGLRTHRVTIIWLSMVSAKLFLRSSELFSELKALTPCVKFLVEHPGSSRYAKMGLESFVFMNEKEGGKMEEGMKVSKAECLLTAPDMERDKFPIPCLVQKEASEGQDSSSYFKLCKEWPEVMGTQATNSFPMFAVDCEMVETKDGLELARVSLVNEALQCVYDTLVKPENPILDYKTKYSGISEETLRDVSTTLSDVHRDLSLLLPPQCILIGHSLENDLHALKMLHPYVIDTSCLFLPSVNCTMKPGLRLLAKKLLGADIQGGENGHCSIEDASTCMKLVLKRIRDGEVVNITWKRRSILSEVASLDHSVATIDRNGVVGFLGPHTNKYPVTTDKEAVEKAKVAITEHDLTFVQLHSYEEHLKTSAARDMQKTTGVLSQLDSRVMDIIASCPSSTVVFVVCGSSDIREVKQLQQRQNREKLEQVVAVARTGLTYAYIVK